MSSAAKQQYPDLTNEASPTLDGYGGPGKEIIEVQSQQQADDGGLPFTGYDAGLVGIFGLIVAVVGAVLYRATRPQNDKSPGA